MLNELAGFWLTWERRAVQLRSGTGDGEEGGGAGEFGNTVVWVPEVTAREEWPGIFWTILVSAPNLLSAQVMPTSSRSLALAVGGQAAVVWVPGAMGRSRRRIWGVLGAAVPSVVAGQWSRMPRIPAVTTM